MPGAALIIPAAEQALDDADHGGRLAPPAETARVQAEDESGDAADPDRVARPRWRLVENPFGESAFADLPSPLMITTRVSSSASETSSAARLGIVRSHLHSTPVAVDLSAPFLL